MFRLAFILHLFIGSTIAGSAIVVALTMGYDTMAPILWAALIGFIASFPVTYLVTKALYERV
ncbi:CTP synthetase [Shimia sp. SDUM112013]|uniref:CTP synthetase n=1 Tax=Shimia sp. SDUM112013 TaxID=3136160 RepID=UPI0032EEE6F8